MKDAIVCDGRFRVFADGSINQIVNGEEMPAKTYYAGRSTAPQKYKFVYWTENGKRRYEYVHRLVAQAFIPNPQNKPEVNHIDGNKENNAITNLEWATRSENARHAYESCLILRKRNAKRCLRCGELTNSKTGYCRKCLSKINSQKRKEDIAKELSEKYGWFETDFLTDREGECVELAKTGMRQAEIAKLIGITRERVRQLLKKAEEKQTPVRKNQMPYIERIQHYNFEKQSALQLASNAEEADRVIRYLRKKWAV